MVTLFADGSNARYEPRTEELTRIESEMQFVFWQNILSPHQAGFIRELAKRGHDITIVTLAQMSDERRRQGWKVPELSPARVVVASSKSDLLTCFHSSEVDSIHVIAGIRTTSLGRYIAKRCIQHRRRVGILTEAPDPRGFAGVLRKQKYSLEHRLIGSKYDFVLAMGKQGVSWFKACGYLDEKLFPFCYVIEPHSPRGARTQTDRVRLCFVGRLVELKGVDLILQAIKNVHDVELAIIGNGPEMAPLKAIVSELEIADRTTFWGQVSNEEVMFKIGNSDLLIVPSRKDGWAAVINESLMLGTPVICSDACGGADLLQETFLGCVFESESVEQLSNAIADWAKLVRDGKVSNNDIIAWAECVTPNAVATYFEQIISHVYYGCSRPSAPWRG